MVLKDSCCLEWVDGVRGSREDLEGARWVPLPFSSLQAHLLQLPPRQLSRLKQRTAGFAARAVLPRQDAGEGGWRLRCGHGRAVCPPGVLAPSQPAWGLLGLPALPNETSAGILSFAAAADGDPMGPSAHRDAVSLVVWHITTGAVVLCLLSQHFRILWDGHHLGTQKAVSRSCLIYSHSWQDPSHRMQKRTPPSIPSPGKRQPRSAYIAACSSGEKCGYNFQMPRSWKQVPRGWVQWRMCAWEPDSQGSATSMAPRKSSAAHRTVMQSRRMLNSWFKRVSEHFSVRSLPPWRCLLCSLCFPSISFLSISHH